MNWQTMDTAPKDGTLVLIATHGFEHFRQDGAFVERKCYFFWIARWQAYQTDPTQGRFVCDDGLDVPHPTHWAAITPPTDLYPRERRSA